jgi:hypothetical protein
MNVSIKLTLISLLAMVIYTASVHAQQSGTSMFSFNGFGTAGLVHSSEDKADFTSSVFKPAGAGRNHSWSPHVDSLIAAQVTAKLTPKLSAVVQVISEHNYDNTYRPHLEWANIKYQITPNFSVRAGRTVLPAFLISDTRKVGYTYPWVRPPLEVYRLLPVTNSDGVDSSYRLHFGNVTNTVQVKVGRNDPRLPSNIGGVVDAKQVWSISNTTEYGALTTHITYLQADLTIAPLNTFFDSFRNFGAQGIVIADHYDSNDKHMSLLALSASYDPGKWFVTAEWGHRKIQSSLGILTAWYVSSGYRFDKFTPYVTFARATADNLSDPGLTVSDLPPSHRGQAIELNIILNSLLSMKAVQNTASIGTRWDFMKNTAIKVQFDHTDIGTGSTGVLRNTQPGFQPGGKVNVFSTTIDFVF